MDIPWVPQTFHARFPVSVNCRPATDTKASTRSREKTFFYPGWDRLSEHGLKLEKVGPTFSSFKAMPANISITNKYYV